MLLRSAHLPLQPGGRFFPFTAGPTAGAPHRLDDLTGIEASRCIRISLTMSYSPSKSAFLAAFVFSLAASSLAQKATHTLPASGAIDAQAKKVMASTHANGLAIALIDNGKVGYVQAYGIRNAKGEPL